MSLVAISFLRVSSAFAVSLQIKISSDLYKSFLDEHFRIEKLIKNAVVGIFNEDFELLNE